MPPEILSRIARGVLDDRAENASSVIPLTHVCRYWRESIVSAPENWALISSRSKDLTALSLERSKEAPLQIYLDMDQVRETPKFVDLITPYIHNAETLEFVNLKTVDDLKRTLPNFPRTMPNLRSLDLSIQEDSPDWDPTIDPFGLFSPSLRHLLLYDIPLYPSFLNLKTLTEFTLHDYNFNLHLDTLLTILEENCSLERVFLWIWFMDPSLLDSRRRALVGNQLRHLSVTYHNVGDARALISRIPLHRGAILEIDSLDRSAELNDLLSGISTAHLGNLASPTRMESYERNIRLLGPNGEFSFHSLSVLEMPFVRPFPLSLTSVREMHLGCPEQRASTITPRAFHPSPFPALEALAIKNDTNVLVTLSVLLSAPASSPSLKTLAFLDCNLSGDFMEELTRFVSNRKKTPSAWLHRVVIIHSGERFPSAASICALGKHVPVVDVRFGTKLPVDLV